MAEDRYVFVVGMDIPTDKEELFNEVYDEEHLPFMLQVPGFLSATRYQAAREEDSPKYLAIYELSGPEVLESDEYKEGRDKGRWPTEVRPHTYNKESMRGLYRLRTSSD